MNYSEKLKHPKWQKKRLEILQRDKFMCQDCGDTESELHVHHIHYIFGKEIWDYENEMLTTLCAECHKYITELKKDIKQRIDINCVYGDTLSELSLLLKIVDNMNPFDIMSIRKMAAKYNDKRIKKLLKHG